MTGPQLHFPVRTLIPSFHPRTRLEQDSAPLAIPIAFPGLKR